jgi:hypothetical protein
MATIEEQLKTLLNPLVSNQVFPMIAPDSTLGSYITYQNIINSPENTLADGISINNTRMQIDCWADDYATVKALASDIADALSAASFTNIQKSTRDGYEPVVKKFRVILDYSFWWN